MLGATKRLAAMYCQALDGDVRARAGPGRPPMRLIACGSATCWRRTARWRRN
jgi:hypothetical protein